MQQQRPSRSGRPEGTDGSDYSYRMTVDPRYTKVAKGKAHLKLVIFLQILVQALGVLYVFLFPPKAGVFNALTVAAVLSGVVIYGIGEIGRRRSRVVLLQIYKCFSLVATVTAVLATAKHIIDFKREQEQNGVQGSGGWLGMHPAYIFLSSHLLLGALVEAYREYVISHLTANMTPPKIE